MPFTPNKLARRRVSTTFPFNGEDMTVEYYPAALNEDSTKERNRLVTQAQLLAKQYEDIPADKTEERAAIKAQIDAVGLQFAEWLCTFLCGWEYFEDTEDGSQGAMVPLTSERLIVEMERYPDFVTACALAVLHDFQEGNANGAASSVRSGATFLPTEQSTTSMVGRSRKS